MKKIILAVLSCLFLLFSANDAKAVIWGADISWTCLGDTAFIIKVSVYRDCNSGALSGSNITLTPQGCSGSAYSYSGTLINSFDITPVCKKSCTRCSNSSCSFQYGVQQWEQVQTVHFPISACCKYMVHWQECCRDSNITTIKPGNFFISALLNRCDTPCDASPYFSNPPINIITANRCYTFNYGAIDNNIDAKGNADSLTYHLVNPEVDSLGTSVTWVSPYNVREPLDYGGGPGKPNGTWDPAMNVCNGFHLDSLTGDLYFKPTKAETAVFAIQVQAWKKDSSGTPYIAMTVTRDAEIVVMDTTTNRPPTLTGINGTHNTFINFCVGEYNCIRIYSYDQDTADTVTVTWDNSIPGAKFITNFPIGRKHPVATFCWKPTEARSYPYYFTVSAQDNSCPLLGRTSRSFGIIVNPQPKANDSATVSNCGVATFSASAITGKGLPAISSYEWYDSAQWYTPFITPVPFSTSQNFTHKYRKWGTYKYVLEVIAKTGCANTYTDSVVIPKSVEVSLPSEDTTIFTGTTMTVGTSTILGTGPYSYSWNCSSATTSSIKYTFTKDTMVYVTITDATGCTNYDSMLVHVVPLRAMFTIGAVTCVSKPVNFADQSQVASSCGTINKRIWYFGDGNTDTSKNPSHTYGSAGIYIVSLKDSSGGGCTDSVSKTVVIGNVCNFLKSAFNFPDSTCLHTSVSFSDSSKSNNCGTITKRSWSFGDGGTDTVQNPSHTYTSSGSFTVKLTDSSSGGCVVSSSKTIYINPLPTANAGSNSTICLGGSTSIGSTAVSGNTYSWTSSPTGFTSSASSPLVTPTVTTTYFLTEKIPSTGCSKSDSTVITVNPIPAVNAGTGKAICYGGIASIGASAISGDTYSWTSSPAGFTNTSSNPSVSPIATTTYYLTESKTATGCSNSDSVVITVNALPTVNAGTNLSVCSGVSASIGAIAVSGDSYSWTSHPAGFANTNANPSVSPTITTTYYLTESIAATGCSKNDSVIVNVNALPNSSFNTSINNYTVKYSPADTSLASYNWSFGDGNTDTSIHPSYTYKSNGKYEVKLSVKNTNGCSSSDSASVPINSVSAAFNANDTGCTYTTISFSDSSKSTCGTINHWAWTFGDGGTSATQNPSHTYNTAGSYAVKLTVSSSGSCTDSFTKSIFIDSTCVWPGDANNDKVADTNDVLSIGIAYGETGAKRSNTSTNWLGQYCDNWANKFSNGANHKHADCNGDGIVDSVDMKAVNANWGKTHLKTGQSKTGNPKDPGLSLQFSKSNYNPGDTVNADIMLASATTSLSSVYGLTSGFDFDPSFVDTSSLKIGFGSSWFGTPGKDMVSFIHKDFGNNSLAFAITRIDHKNTSGYGKIGTVSFIIPATANNKTSSSFKPGSGKAISFDESIIPLYLPGDSFNVGVATGILPGWNKISDINLYPNPANTTINMESAINFIRSVTIYDVTGKEVYREERLNTQNQSVPVSHFAAGIYIIKVGLDNGTYEAKFMKE